MSEELGTTASGLKPAHAAVFAYLFSVIPFLVFVGLIFFFLEKNNRFVRFHAMQSICFSIGVFLLMLALRMLPVVGGAFAGLAQATAFVIWIVLIVKAGQGKWFRLPVAGDIAAKQAGI